MPAEPAAPAGTEQRHPREAIDEPAAPPPQGRRDPSRAEFIAGDPIRGLGSLMVMTAHIAIATIYVTGNYRTDFYAAYGSIAARAFNNLDIAVSFFFVLSGYLLARPFIGSVVDGRRLPSIGRYIEGRLLRLVPAMWVGFAFALLVFGPLGSSFLQLAAVPLFAQAYHPSQFSSTATSHFWTLDVEIVFYALLPLGALLLIGAGRFLRRREQRIALALLGALVVAGVSIWLRSRHPYTYADYQHRFPVWLCTFAAGIGLATLELFVPARVEGRRRGRWIALAAIALGIAALAAYLFTSRERLLVGGVLLVGGIALVMGGALVRQWTDGHCWRVLDNLPLRWIGHRSYSLYVFHVSILHLIVQHVHSRHLWRVFGVVWVIEVPLALFAAYLGFRFIEAPFMRRRPRWRAG